MAAKRAFKVSLTATIVAAICCFTPVLVWLLTAIGLAGLVGWIDYVALPALGIFAALTLIYFFKMRAA